MPSASTLVHAVSAIESAVSPSARYTIAFDIVPPGEQPSVISVSATCGARSNARATAYATAGISSHCDARPTPEAEVVPRLLERVDRDGARHPEHHAAGDRVREDHDHQRSPVVEAVGRRGGGGGAGGAASDSARPRSDGAATTRAAAASSDGVPPTEAAVAGANSAAEAPTTTGAFISPRGSNCGNLSVTGGLINGGSKGSCLPSPVT